MTRRQVEALRPGDVILPPARELSLWMRRHAREQGLPETALYLTVREIREAAPDTRGRWLYVKSEQTREWNAKGGTFTFKARPETPWSVVSEVCVL